MIQPSPSSLAPPLLRWYDQHGRELPWRGAPAYGVWVSEIMLQQTRVETVLPRYAEFLRRFPSVEVLAQASEEEVRASWSGLGFYRRASNLHRAAKQVMEEFHGQIPSEPKSLASLPGVGRYTLGAIGSAAFGLRLPILDGNVARVLSRVFCVAGAPKDSRTKKRLWGLAQAVLPKKRVGDFNQALMDLGATVCTPRSPTCPSCPLASQCQAHSQEQVHRYPEPAPNTAVPTVHRVALVLLRLDGSLALTQRPATGLLASLWEPPSWELNSPRGATRSVRARARKAGLPYLPLDCGTVSHRFSHRLWLTRVYRAEASTPSWPQRLLWTKPQDLARLGIPTLTQKLLRAAEKQP